MKTINNTTFTYTYRTLSFFLLGVLVFSCKSFQTVEIDEDYVLENCFNQEMYEYSESDFPQPLDDQDLSDMIYDIFTEESIRIGNAIDVLDLLELYLETLEEYKEADSFENRVRQIEVYQRLMSKIYFAEMEILSLSSQLDCEEERTSQVANHLSSRERDLNTRFTIATILIGAGTVIVTNGFFDDDRPTRNAISISVAVVETGLGLWMLRNRKRTEFNHEKNLLTDIYEGPAVSNYYPASVWYFLNNNKISFLDDFEIRQEIKQRWMNLGMMGDANDKKKEALKDKFFGSGGEYQTNELEYRATMYNQLSAQINLMSQQLKAFVQELEIHREKRIYEDGPGNWKRKEVD